MRPNLRSPDSRSGVHSNSSSSPAQRVLLSFAVFDERSKPTAIVLHHLSASDKHFRGVLSRLGPTGTSPLCVGQKRPVLVRCRFQRLRQPGTGKQQSRCGSAPQQLVVAESVVRFRTSSMTVSVALNPSLSLQQASHRLEAPITAQLVSQAPKRAHQRSRQLNMLNRLSRSNRVSWSPSSRLNPLR